MLPRPSIAVLVAIVGLASLTTGCGDGVVASCARVACASECVDVLTDPRNCGACGIACPSDNVCSLGRCSTSCAVGLTVCPAGCFNVSIDPANCGRCARLCDALAVFVVQCGF